MGHCVPVYLINSRTQKFFGITIFGTRKISADRTRSYKSTLSIALIRASSATILSSDDLVLRDSLENTSINCRG
jgi:hypothetical protein